MATICDVNMKSVDIWVVIVPDPCRNFLLLPKNIGGDIFRLFNILYRNLI